jgi:hypothetical protein
MHSPWLGFLAPSPRTDYVTVRDVPPPVHSVTAQTEFPVLWQKSSRSCLALGHNGWQTDEEFATWRSLLYSFFHKYGQNLMLSCNDPSSRNFDTHSNTPLSAGAKCLRDRWPRPICVVVIEFVLITSCTTTVRFDPTKTACRLNSREHWKRKTKRSQVHSESFLVAGPLAHPNFQQ